MPSVMFTSIPARSKGSTNFESYYNNLCALQDSVPVQSVKAHLAEGALDINADRIRLPDWGPILNSIRINKSLSFIGIRSYFQQTKDSDACGRHGVRRRPPAVRSKEVVNRLSLSLKECLLNSRSLQYLEIQGLPLKEKDITNLSKGLSRASSLEHLSLEGCRLSNKAVAVLCHNIRNSTALVSLNLTGCGLTCNAAQSISKVVKHQSTRLHSEAWKESLRYRRPDLDRMAGIRRITLNANPLLNDEGAAAFADAIKDDLWLKALDLQNCGLSNTGAQVLLNTLHQNSTIVVLDLRKNPLIDHEIVKAVIEQVMINGGGHESEYKWLRSSESAEKPKRRKVKHVSTAVSKKSSKPTSTVRVSRSRIRSKSADGRLSKNDVPTVRRPGPGFVPWRTAARAVTRATSAERGKNDSDVSTTPTKDSPGVHFHLTTTSTPAESDTSVKDTSSYDKLHGSPNKWNGRMGNDKKRVDKEDKKKVDKELRVELEEIRRRYDIESQARNAANARLIELEVENSRLRHEIQLLQARGASSPFKKQPDDKPDAVGDIDEAVLDSIEESFRKFHTFLDLLRDAGLGQLCSLVGLSPGDVKDPSVLSILQDHQPTPFSKATHQQQFPGNHYKNSMHQEEFPGNHHKNSVMEQEFPGNHQKNFKHQQEFSGNHHKNSMHQQEFLGKHHKNPMNKQQFPGNHHNNSTHQREFPGNHHINSMPLQQYNQQPVSFGDPIPPPLQQQHGLTSHMNTTNYYYSAQPVQIGPSVPIQAPVPGWLPQSSVTPIPQQYFLPSEPGWQPPPPPPTGYTSPYNMQNIHYTQSTVASQSQQLSQNQCIINPPQREMIPPSTVTYDADKIHMVGPSQTQDILDHRGNNKLVTTSSLEGQEATETKRYQNIVESGIAIIPNVSSAKNIPELPSDAPAKHQTTNDMLQASADIQENNNDFEKGLVIKGGKVERLENTKDIHYVNEADNKSGPKGDADLPSANLLPSPDKTSSNRTPSPVYSDSWASGSSKQSNIHSERSVQEIGKQDNFKSENSARISDLESDRSSPLDIVEEILDYSSDNEF
ncbi:centrosomal protein of 78 kDa-like [Antedon mediterranea]|uniref:centrosomal protein of 78 kDa-like n=1 Tax=Antedon mediterranea TaxID=105859 RepID=UPI003AF931F0